MRHRAALYLLAAAVALLLTWKIPINSFDVQEKARNILDSNYIDRIKGKFKAVKTSADLKCRLSKVCPPDHFAMRLTSGAADVVGPQICFEGKIIMSHVLNNVGPGLNIAVIDGETGIVEKIGSINMQKGRKRGEAEEEVLEYLKEIKPGMIVLVASFGDVTPKLTEEVRGLFAGMGSALVTSVKARDNWVFAGRAGGADRSLYEKPSTKRKPTPTRAGRGRWRLEAVIHGPKLTRPRKKKKNISPGVAGLL
ncbi:protein FAM3C isoform X2 [Takifugu rubripes]|uniref:protein FAM3C isoform X2 n=1 Tax=Takifugu rubripes TaxID=31033 RepID=UPI0011459ED3|nr:protein FAM3C-like isoform X2 [Takifugu rubripes]